MHRFLRSRMLALALVFVLRDSAPGSVDVTRLTFPAQEVNAEFSTPRIPPAGIVLRWRQPACDLSPELTLSLTLHTDRPRFSVDPKDLWGADFADRIQLHAYTGRNAVESNSLVVKRRSRGWRVYVDGRLSASFPDRFGGEVELRHDTGLVRRNEEGEDDAYVQRVAPFRFTDDFLIDEADVEGRRLGHWESRNGQWLVHSVVDAVLGEAVDPARNPNPRRQRMPEAARSPNFYCVEGFGTNALLLAGHDFYDRHTLSAALHPGVGENGIVFLVTPGGSFHALTAAPAPDENGLRLTLWKTDTGRIEDRQILAQQDTDLLPGQWHRISVTLHDDRIIGIVNNITVFQIPAELVPGGRFGLFAHGPSATRFDDVEAFSHEDLHFETTVEFRKALLHAKGSLERRRGALPLSLFADTGARQAAEHVRLEGTAEEPGLVLFGAVNDGAHVLATAVAGDGRPFEAALVTAWQGPEASAIRFVLRQTATDRIFLLQEATGGIDPQAELARWSSPAKPSSASIELMLDATDPDGVLRAYADGTLVLIAPMIKPWRGASGFHVPPGGKVSFALPFYATERRVYRNKFEKNETFVSDPFMRHWASPEGEWVTLPDGRTWLKGDIFGAVSIQLPWVEPTRLHLAVPEDQTEGPLQIVAADGALTLAVPATAGAEGEASSWPKVPMSALDWQPTDEKGSQSNRWYAVQLEGHVLWARSGNRILFTHSLPSPAPGRRVRLEGLTVEHLGRSRVERTGVVDFLFTESLHEWTLNGGVWEVVNRFQCDPRWSHLTGQSADSLAAIWARYEFEGDFNAELYSGMRHGWYDRPGDLNLTVLGSADSPASGYTFVCTGWDPDESQLHSRVFRNGELLESSDRYLVPRVREGSVRRGYTPLIAAGRDVHGAWYYTVMQRSGSTLKVSFDHEPVFSLTDSEPLQAGGLGLWTYRNSMVVARVKMSAEKIRPKRFSAIPVDPKKGTPPSSPVDPWPVECAKPIVAVANAAGLPVGDLRPSPSNPRYPALPDTLSAPATTQDVSIAFWTPDVWMPHDPVSHLRLDWRPTATAPDKFVATARQAGGSFFVTNTLAAVPLRLLAGWRFEMARTDDAQINFHYTVGRMTSAGFEPAQALFHQLSGSDEIRGPALRSGTTRIPSCNVASAIQSGPWTEVQVWLPAFPKEEETLWVRVDGFGNLQPSDVQQGLHGNLPGAAYAVRGFAPVLLGAPALTGQRMSPKESVLFQNAVSERTSTAIHQLVLPSSVFPLAATVYWVLPPDNLELKATWSTEFHDVVEIRSEIPWPVRHLKGLPVTVNGHAAMVIPREGNLLHVLIPRGQKPDPTGFYQVDLATGTRRPVGWKLTAAARTTSVPPVLLALESESFHLQTFEQNQSPPPGAVSGSIRLADSVQGSHLRTSNAGRALRLVTPLLGQTDLAGNPVVQFRYRCDPMARVSLRMERLGDVAFTETPPYRAARAVRGTSPGTSEAWTTWTGLVTDGIADQPYATGTFLTIASLMLQSADRFDQTGLHSTLFVDDIVAGPATGPHRPLSITPRLLDLDGDGHAEWAVSDGGVAPSSVEADGGKELQWFRAEPDHPADITFEGRADGLYQVLFRSASPRGKGAVISVPVLLDRTPMSISHTIESTPETGNGTLLAVHFGLAGGSPPRFDTLRVTSGEQEIDLRYGTVRVGIVPERATMRIDWPLLLQSQIQRMGDGDTIPLTFGGLQDGAGNTSEPYAVSIPIRYAEDKTPPTIRQTILAPNIAWMASWTEPIYRSTFRAMVHCAAHFIPATDDKAPALQLNIGGNSASATEQFARLPWNPDRFPYLALRVGFAKLPPKTEPNTLRLVLQYKHGNGKVKTVHADLLTEAIHWPKAVSGVADWTEGGISELLIDVRALLRHAGEKAQEGTGIVGIQFEFSNAASAQFQIHQAVICAPWGETDEWSVRAYDASGIAGLTWQGGDAVSEQLSILPASLALPEENSKWLKLRVRDRAGNATHPIPLPMIRVPTPAEQPTP